MMSKTRKPPCCKHCTSIFFSYLLGSNCFDLNVVDYHFQDKIKSHVCIFMLQLLKDWNCFPLISCSHDSFCSLENILLLAFQYSKEHSFLLFCLFFLSFFSFFEEYRIRSRGLSWTFLMAAVIKHVSLADFIFTGRTYLSHKLDALVCRSRHSLPWIILEILCWYYILIIFMF